MESQIQTQGIGELRRRIQYHVQRTQVQLQDQLIDLDEITELEDSSLFKIARKDSYVSQFESDLIAGFVIMADLDLRVIQRHGYTLFDFFSDIGGI